MFLAERYSYGTDGELPGAVAVLGITSLTPDQASAARMTAVPARTLRHNVATPETSNAGNEPACR